MDSLLTDFFRGDYMPHGHCYLWEPSILWTNVVSDLFIALAYFSIPIALMVLIKKRPDLGDRRIFALFSSFILLCGITHLIAIFTIWHGVYGLHGISKAVTAFISCITAIFVYRALPALVNVVTPSQYQEVSQRLAHEEKRREELEFSARNSLIFKFVTDTLPTGTVLIDTQHTLVMANRQFFQMVEPSTETLENIKLGQVLCLSDDNLLDECLSKALFEPQRARTQLKTHTGQWLDVEIRMVAEVLINQTYILLTIEDLSASLATQRALAASHERLQRVTEASNDGLWEWDISTDELWLSDGARQLSRLPITQSQTGFGQWIRQIPTPQQDELLQAIETCKAQGTPFKLEIALDSQPTPRWFLWRGVRSTDSQGETRYLSGAITDIQSQKAIQQELQQNNEFLNTIFHGTSYGIFIVEVRGPMEFIYTNLNQANLNFVGCELADVQGKQPIELSPTLMGEAEAREITARYQSCVEARETVSYMEQLTLEGQSKWFQTSLFPMINDAGEVYQIIGSASEITAVKAAEQQLSEEQKYSQLIIDNSYCGIYIYSFEQDSNILINHRYTDILGYTLDELQGMGSLVELFHPDDKDFVLTHLNDIKEHPSSGFSEIQYRFRHKQGHWVWCHSYDSVLRLNRHGDVTQMLGSFVDITAIKDYANKLEESNHALEQFAYVASHDLQEPLRKLTAFADSLERKLGPSLSEDKGGFELGRISDAAHRMRELIRDLLALSRIRGDQLQREEVNVSQLLTEVKDLLSVALAESGAKIEQQGDASLKVDKVLFVTLLQNLINNSIKFAKEDTPARIQLTIEEDKEHPGYCQIRIKDNGVGFDAKHAKDVFIPFKRLVTRSQVSGSGIGLAIVKRIVDIHQGDILCHAEPAKGAEFTIILPPQAVLEINHA